MTFHVSQHKLQRSALRQGIKEGSLSIPYILLRGYSRLHLSELDMMLLLHLIAFVDKEKIQFPTIQELQERMSAPPELVISSLQKLLKEKIILIEDHKDEETGIHYERYNLDPLYDKIADLVLDEQLKRMEEHPAEPEVSGNLFSIFEQEFARPLTPMELETISGWLDQDQYAEELILAALKEAVFAGKIHFRYIDRILLEWGRNRIQTAQQAKEFTQRFRGSR
ncbi:DnaD domain-containing protein [Paenibacillus larvae]